MAKLCTVMMTEAQLLILITTLIGLKHRMLADGRVDLVGRIDELLNTLEPREVTPVEV